MPKLFDLGAHIEIISSTWSSEKVCLQICCIPGSFRKLKRMHLVFSQTTGMPGRRKRTKEMIILVATLYKEHSHIQSSLLCPDLSAPLPFLPGCFHTLDENKNKSQQVIRMCSFLVLAGLMPNFFNVSYLNWRTMAEDERVKKPSYAISLFVKSNDLVS